MTISFPTLATLAGFFAISATTLTAQEFRTIDGSGNNLGQPAMGSADSPLVRSIPSDYADGVSAPAGPNRPSPRSVSNLVCAQDTSIPNNLSASDYLWQWGQFLDHDIDLSVTDDGNPLEALPIEVPMGDPFFDPASSGTVTIDFTRSVFEPGSVPRQQLNAITAWIDASQVYGSDSDRALELRTIDGTGRLRTSPGELLPFNTGGFENAQPPGLDPGLFFLAGDVRANEQAALTAMHTLFVREHNRLAVEIAAGDPTLSGDAIYLRARRLVGAQMQRITYEEFLPLLLGPGALPDYLGYDPLVEAGIRNVFSTACYRVGHSMLSTTIRRIAESGIESPAGHLPLAVAFFAPETIIDEGGIEPILRGLATQRAQEIDPLVVGAVRNFLFGPPGSGGFDLASLNIQRGRDHGLPSYNAARVGLGLPARTSFTEITADPLRQQALSDAYGGDLDAIDLWVGALCEDHVPGSMVGELMQTVLVEQFAALRDGDRFWYQIDLSPPELAEIEATTLSMIIVRNTTIEAMPGDVFRVTHPDFIRGDCNGDSLYDIGDAISTLDFLFDGGTPSGCADACDANGDDLFDIGDGVYTLMALFGGGSLPSAPHPDCGAEPVPDDDLPCFTFESCP